MLVGIPPVRCCGGAVERGPISKWKTDRLWMGHKLLRLKPGVPAGGFRREVSVQRRTLAGAAALPPCRTDRSPSRQLRANSDGIATLRYSLRRRHDSYDTGPKASLKNRRRE